MATPLKEKEDFDPINFFSLEEEEEEVATDKAETNIDSSSEDFDPINFFSLEEEEEEVTSEQPSLTKEKTPTKIEDIVDYASDRDYALSTYMGEEGDKTNKKTYNQFIKDEGFLRTANDYMTARFGKEGARKEGETNQEFTDRFIEHYRDVSANTFDLMAQVDWVRTANNRDKANYGALFRDMEKLPEFYEEGGTGWIDGIMDYGSALLTDPLSYLGFGAGAVAKFGATQVAKKALLEGGKAATKQVSKEALERGVSKEFLKRNKAMVEKVGAKRAAGEVTAKTFGQRLASKEVAIPFGIEMGADVATGMYHVNKTNELQQDAHITEEDASALEYGLVGGASALLTGGLGIPSYLAFSKWGDKSAARSVKIMQENKLRVIQKQKAKVLGQKFGQQQFQTKDANAYLDLEDPIKELDWDEAVKQGRDILDALDPELVITKEVLEDVTQRSLQEDIQKRVAKVTLDVLKEMKDKRGDVNVDQFLDPYIKQQKKATQAIGEILQALVGRESSLVDNEFIEGSIARAGLTSKQFYKIAENAGVPISTASEAGKALGASSPLGKFFTSLRKADPELQKEFEKKFGKDNPEFNMVGRAYDMMMRLDRERRALMVTQLATTVRNVGTGVIRLTFEGGANLIESTLYNVGRGAKSLYKGEGISSVGIANGVKNVFHDTFDTIFNIARTSETKDLAEDLLKYNPSLLRQMDRSLQEVGADQTLSGFTRGMNYLNMAQDKIFRRAVFTATLDKQLRRMGTNVNEVIADGRPLPTKMLQQAMEDSLHFTFARMPKAGGDKVGDNIGSLFVKANEKLGPLPGLAGVPFGTGAFPYARFMVNALQFQLQYQPLSALSALMNGSRGAWNVMKGTKGEVKDLGWRQIAKAREQMAKASIGTAAFAAAVKYRSENQDIKWYEYKTEDGRTSDLRPFFPLAPYLLMGELWNAWTDDKEGAKLSFGEALEGYTGAIFRGGSGMYLADNFFKFLGDPDAKGGMPELEKVIDHVATYTGELVGGAFTPAKMITDIQGALDIEAAYVRDAKQIEGEGLERAQNAFVNASTRNLPFLGKWLEDSPFYQSYESLPIAESATREAPMIKQSPLRAQLTGVRTESVRNTVEEELSRFNMKPWDVVPTTGDKRADAYVKRFMGKLADRYIGKELNKKYYRNLPENKQKIYFKSLLADFRKEAKDIGEDIAYIEAKAKGKRYTPFDRAQWTRLTSAKRELADEYYMERYGKTVMEMQEEEPNKNHLLIGKEIANDLYKEFKY